MTTPERGHPARLPAMPQRAAIACSMCLALAIALLVMPTAVFAGDYKPLTGAYALGGKTLSDPPADEPQNTHVYFALTGAPAKDLFDSMKVKAVRDVCVDDGSVSKQVQEMRCTRSADGKEHRCWFGIDIAKQRITSGVTC